jgi:hypothetical protein
MSRSSQWFGGVTYPYPIHRRSCGYVDLSPPLRAGCKGYQRPCGQLLKRLLTEGTVTSKCKHDPRRIHPLSGACDKLSTGVRRTTHPQTAALTCTMMIKLQMASMPRFPRVSKNNCPIGNGSSEAKRSLTDVVANDAVMGKGQL